jgi:hypothetical protein
MPEASEFSRKLKSRPTIQLWSCKGARMGRTLAPIDLRVISNVFLEISRSPWFEPGESRALALYLIHQYSRGLDESSLKAVAEPFAREWFRGRPRFDALEMAAWR